MFSKYDHHNFSQTFCSRCIFCQFLLNFDRMIFATLSLPVTMWYVVAVWDPEMVRDQKKLGNH